MALIELLTQRLAGDNVVFSQLTPLTQIFQGSNYTTFYGFVLPWIFAFAIMYALLAKVEPLKDKNVRVALAFVIAFFVVGIGGPTLAQFFTNLFGGAAVFLAGILVILLFAAMVGGEKHIQGKMITAIVVIVIAIMLFIGSSPMIMGQRIYIDQMTATMIFWIVVIVAAAYLIITKNDTTGSGGGEAPKAPPATK